MEGSTSGPIIAVKISDGSAVPVLDGPWVSIFVAAGVEFACDGVVFFSSSQRSQPGMGVGFAIGVIGTITVSTDVVTSSSLSQSVPALPGQMTCGMAIELVTWGESGLTYGLLGWGA